MAYRVGVGAGDDIAHAMSTHDVGRNRGGDGAGRGTAVGHDVRDAHVDHHVHVAGARISRLEIVARGGILRGAEFVGPKKGRVMGHRPAVARRRLGLDALAVDEALARPRQGELVGAAALDAREQELGRRRRGEKAW